MSDLTLDFRAANPPRPMGFQIAPLIDIVFLLICFFMLATQLIQTQADPSVRLPAMSHRKAGPETPAEIIVNVRRDGTLMVNGDSLALTQLAPRLAAEVARQGARETPLRVVIRADRRQRFDQLDKALDACRQAGVTAILLRAEREGAP